MSIQVFSLFFFIGLFVVVLLLLLLLILSYMKSLYILVINPLLVILFANIFSHGYLLVFQWLVSFAIQKLLTLVRSHLFIFAFVSVALGERFQIILLHLCRKVFFSSRSFIVSGLTFRSLIHFEIIFVHGVRKCSNFILLHVSVYFSQNHLLKRLSFLC